ncbi:MAG TPA: hypothetical protein VME63_12410 [Dyella sp.]|uniref:hypothetical protein n=1 Tax=Dyella sp. TaxID=1869338 RepID=UPI002B7AE7E3|nr:hypothetical protein [Dyella sp.]HTV86206.1 hypothetical protein [Dyella sp.]
MYLSGLREYGNFGRAAGGDSSSWSSDQFPAGALELAVNQSKMLDFFQAGKTCPITIQALQRRSPCSAARVFPF